MQVATPRRTPSRPAPSARRASSWSARRARRGAVVTALAAGAVLLAPVPSAQALDVRAPAAGSGAPATASQGSCSLYGSPRGFGMVCSPATGSGGSLRDLLDGKPLTGCWNERTPDGFTAKDPEDGGRWFQRICLEGVDLQTLQRTGGPVKLVYNYEIVEAGEPVVTLTAGEEDVVQSFVGRRQIAFPALSISPASFPRVGQISSFYLNSNALPDRTRTLDLIRGQGAGQVTMYAKVIGLTVDPGDGGKLATCEGPGQPRSANQMLEQPVEKVVCAHTYERSSADPDAAINGDRDRYRATATATWEIRYFGGPDDGNDDNDRILTTIEKAAVNLIRVTEIQTLVVS